MHAVPTNKHDKLLDQGTLKLFLKAFVPMLLLALGIILYWYLNYNPPQVVHTTAALPIPTVKVAEVVAQRVTIPVTSRGEVNPANEIQLTVETSGQVIFVAPQLATGGMFKKGDLLLKVDDTRYRLDVVRAEAQVVSVRQAYRQVKDEVDAAEDIEGLASPRRYREQRVAEVAARLNAAEAELRLVRIQVNSTRLIAPFTGRVHRAFVGLGQYVAPGVQIAQVYPIDKFEVRLPLSEQQLGLIDLPGISSQSQNFPAVRLMLDFGGQRYSWMGRVMRTDGGIDPHNRLLYAVAQIDRPYEQDMQQPNRPELTAGQFMEAEIQGKVLNQVVVVPRDALYNGDHVWVVENHRLRLRALQIF